ncbi:MAG: efflux RND transporter periplasmic adaptor subunit [Acidobacteria bacterium]|nr:efflux RND transporter periplasmic adaptor subunit [Acidobacteriota bacterium]
MRRTFLLLLLLCFSLSTAIAHGGETHEDEKKPTVNGAMRQAERSVNTSDGQFKFFLAQSPADPRYGEEVQFNIRLVELVEGGFAGGQAPVEKAQVIGQIKTAGGSPESASIAAHQEAESGTYGIHFTFKNKGDYKLFLEVTTSDNRRISTDFPVAVVAAPVRYLPYALDLLLLAGIFLLLGSKYRAAAKTTSQAVAIRRTLPVAFVALVVLIGAVATVHYLMPSTEPRALAAAPATTPNADPNAITIAKESQLLFGIRTQEVTRSAIVSGVTVTGVVKVRPQFKAEVVPPVSGRTRAVGNLTVGAYVKQGQTLAIVEQVLSAPEAAGLEATKTDLKTKTAALQAQAQQALTRRNAALVELNRAKRLYDAGAVPLRRVQDAEVQLRLADQELTAAQQQAQITQAGEQRVNPVRTFPLLAPVSGVISETTFTSGQQVEAGKSLFTIMNLDRVYLEAQVFEKDLATVTSAKRASFKVTAFPDEVFQIGENTTNRLITVGASVDPEKRTVPVVYEIANPKGSLRDGMFAEITIDTTGGGEVISVPRTAVVDEQGKKVVYVYNGGERFEKRVIRIGSEGQTSVEIQSGLKPGERVVVEGIYQLRSTVPGGSS